MRFDLKNCKLNVNWEIGKFYFLAKAMQALI